MRASAQCRRGFTYCPGMDLGVTIFLTDRSIAPDQLARELEARGLASLYVPEHTHIPVGRKTPYPMGGELPDEYKRTLDPFVALGVAAAVTTELRVGTGVCLVAQHDPILLAKEVATVDLVSNGRFTFGVGYGWNEDEMEDHGVDPTRRRATFREKLLAVQALWSDEEAGFDGQYVRFERSWSWPKPVQQPRPPILFGAAPSPRLFRAIAELGDGWMPIGGAGVRDQLPRLREAFEEAGRDPAEARVIITAVAAPDPGKIDYYASLGVAEVVVGLPSAGADVVLPLLDRIAEIRQKDHAAEFQPRG